MPAIVHRLLAVHWTLTFAAMGVFAALAAWGSVEIFVMLRANLAFVAAYGVMALMEGGGRQLLELLAWGYASLIAYVLFKVCERVLVDTFTRR